MTTQTIAIVSLDNGNSTVEVADLTDAQVAQVIDTIQAARTSEIASLLDYMETAEIEYGAEDADRQWLATFAAEFTRRHREHYTIG